MNSYLADILEQPQALQRTIRQFPAPMLDEIRARLHGGAFDRVVLTGMGASYHAAYPALLQLGGLPIPVMLLNSAELLHSLPQMAGGRTLLWLNSQSGRSIELVRIMQNLERRPVAASLAFVNQAASPLAQSADACLPILAGDEATVSTKTYLNMLACNVLAAVQLAGGSLSAAAAQLESAAGAIGAYLEQYAAHMDGLDGMLGEVERVFILGRGASLAAVYTGALICKEAAKCAFEGMHAADFRHGPLELAGKELCVLFLEGAAQTSALNRNFAAQIAHLGARVLWIGRQPHPHLPSLLLPPLSELALPLAEILPLQMLTLVMARRKGIEPGVFRHIEKVTQEE